MKTSFRYQVVFDWAGIRAARAVGRHTLREAERAAREAISIGRKNVFVFDAKTKRAVTLELRASASPTVGQAARLIAKRLEREARDFGPDLRRAGRGATKLAKVATRAVHGARGWVKRTTGLSPGANCPDGTKVRVQAPFEHRAWSGKIVGRQGPPAHEVFRLLVEPAHGGASVWRRPSELTVLKKTTGLSPIPAHLWVIARNPNPSGGFLVTIGDPYDTRSTLKAILPTKGDLENWILDNVGHRVSPTHVHDATKLVWVKKLLDRKRSELSGVSPHRRGRSPAEEVFTGSLGHAKPHEKRTIRGEVTHVYATGGDVTIKNEGGSHKLSMKVPDYFRTGASYRSMRAALKVQKWVGREVVAEIEYHPAFGWTIFGSKKIRLVK